MHAWTRYSIVMFLSLLPDLSYPDPTPYLEAVRTYAVYLKAIYSRTHDNKWPQFSLFTYNNLAAILKHRIPRDDADKFTIATLHDGIDEILAAKEPIQMEDVLKPLQCQSKINCILVEGPPGVGKSTFAWELCRKWEEIEDLKKFELVVLLRFRDKSVQDAENLRDLFFHPDPKTQEDVTRKMCACNGEGLLLILDGFDEFPLALRKKSFLVDVIKGKVLPGCTVLVTSRPSATADLSGSCKIDKHIEVLGFTQKEIEQYASNAFKSKPELLSDFHKYRKLNPAIRSMMYIPLNMAIVTDVFMSSGKPLSHTTTELYVEMIVIVLKRFFKEIGRDELADKFSTKLDDLPLDIRFDLLQLGEIAFEGTVNQEVIFKALPTDCRHFGFMNTSPELYIRANPMKSYNFLHKSFQDLFTAFHISNLPPTEQKEIFLKYFKNDEFEYKIPVFGVFSFNNSRDDRFKEVWRFLAGLTSFKHIGWDTVKERASTQQLVSYLYEAQDTTACDYVLGAKDHWFNPQSLFDCHAVGWCIGTTQCSFNLKFDFLDPRADVCEAFSSGFLSQKEVHECGFVSQLNLHHISIAEDIVNLLTIPHRIWQQMSALYAAHCQLNRHSMETLATLAHTAVNLNTLNVYGNEVGEGGLVTLFDSLSQHTGRNLTRIDFGGNSIGVADVRALSQLINSNATQLKRMSISDEHSMSVTCQKLLIKVILSVPSLKYIRIYAVEFDSLVCDGFSLLAENHSLVEIVVREIGGPALHSMLKALEHNNSVQKLILEDLKSADIAPLVQLLRVNNFLQSLQVQVYDPLQDEEFDLSQPQVYSRDEQHRRTICLNIIDALRDNCTLEKLKLCAYSSLASLFSHGEMVEMDPRVEFI